MALIKCPECGKEISDQAKSCPSCGYPIVSAGMAAKEESAETTVPKIQPVPVKKGGCLKGCLIVIIGIALFLGIIITFFSVPEDNTASGTKSMTSSKDTSLTKEELGEFDEKVWGQTIEVIKANNNMMDFMNAYADGQASELDFYDACKATSDYCSEASVSFPKGNSEDEKTYVKSCETLALYVQKTADSLKKYIDTKVTKDLSKANENIELTQQALSIVANNRGVFLTESGFSEEEIKALVDKMSEELGE